MRTGFLDAVALLTRLPVRQAGGDGADLARAAVWFPVVGALLGGALVGTGLLLVAWAGLPVPVAVLLVVSLEQLVTGALHLDGLADLADASGGADRQARLRIMKDHATGVYGTAAVVLALLLEGALLVELVPTADPGAAGMTSAVLLGAAAWSLSRAAMLPVALALPYAREDGTGRAVVDGLARRHTLLAWVAPVVLCALLGWTGAAMLGGALAAALLVGAHAGRTLGGATGDVLGATAQAALLAALLGAVAAL
ncbi:cobalamin 5'-phosphate synthase [Ornithinimicrobium sp. CNJ-824]|uniref:adenosylcobinamide-GDP ribazoletransferase n=1 Tax=Ornithinimicrobium sp. CNJ-824 TaxID=1904966 RepID=UPI000965B188|nr:adenosylcobinamide-GDP ribazoletransferase [Ornithinimicrobium sp. CNJ-824]OLT19515.1 cobalamin 5'-phosphate synthase [Ornithinimicrobium sp. CNJ-824]